MDIHTCMVAIYPVRRIITVDWRRKVTSSYKLFICYAAVETPVLGGRNRTFTSSRRCKSKEEYRLKISLYLNPQLKHICIVVFVCWEDFLRPVEVSLHDSPPETACPGLDWHPENVPAILGFGFSSLFLDFSVGARVRSHPSLCAQTLRHVGSGTHGVCKEAAYEFEIQEL